jgi:hypothetical protein
MLWRWWSPQWRSWKELFVIVDLIIVLSHFHPGYFCTFELLARHAWFSRPIEFFLSKEPGNSYIQRPFSVLFRICRLWKVCSETHTTSSIHTQTAPDFQQHSLLRRHSFDVPINRENSSDLLGGEISADSSQTWLGKPHLRARWYWRSSVLSINHWTTCYNLLQ